MRNIFVTLLVIAALIALGLVLAQNNGVGNESQSAPQTASAQDIGLQLPLEKEIDPNGLWLAERGGVKIVATVNNDIVKMTLTSRNVTMIYWCGTLTLPAGEDTVTSERVDPGKAMLSSADSKKFTFTENTMSFEMTVMGNVETVTLARS